MLKIKDASGQVMAVLKDEDSKPELVEDKKDPEKSGQESGPDSPEEETKEGE